MKYIFKEIGRHTSIYFKFVKNCLIKLMIYRTNFFMSMAVEVAFLFTKLLYVLVVYNAGSTIKGFTPDDILLYSGTFIIMSGIHVSLFFFNFSMIQQYIREGTLDMFITKPVSLQFMVTLRNVDIATAIPNILAGIICTVIGWQKAHIPVTAVNLLGYIGFLFTGIILAYCVTLIPELLCFWTINGSAVHELSDSLWNINSMPMQIYKKWMRNIGTFLFPILLISNNSFLFVVGKLDKRAILWGITAPVLCIILVRLVWKKAIRSYSSASS